MVQSRLKYLTGIHIKLDSQDTNKLNALLKLLKEQLPPNLDEIGYLTQHTQEMGEYPDMSEQATDGCLPVSLYLYDECSICRVCTNERFRIYPSDFAFTQLKTLFAENLVLK